MDKLEALENLCHKEGIVIEYATLKSGILGFYFKDDCYIIYKKQILRLDFFSTLVYNEKCFENLILRIWVLRPLSWNKAINKVV